VKIKNSICCFWMSEELGLSVDWSVWEQGAENNIRTQEGGNKGRLEKTA
jgi:hypothetical protein